MTPLVFVHGFMGGSAQWEKQNPLGTERPLIQLDLPGFGKNAHLPVINSIENFAIWALNELSEAGITTFDLMGHSMGGMVVQDMVRLAPNRVSRLILYSTGAVGVLPGRFETIETSMVRAQADGAMATARRMSATWFLNQHQDADYASCAAIAEQASLGAMLAGLEAMRDWSGLETLAKIDKSTLILWGDKDRTYAWPQIELLWKSIPDSHLAVVPQCAHAVHLENDMIFNRLVADFLNN